MKICHVCKATRWRQTKIISHVIDATANGAIELWFHSPDTNVFILSVRGYLSLHKNRLFVKGTGQNHCKIKLQPIFHALGPAKAAALPAFHPLSGTNKTGCFSGKGKASCWKAFMKPEEEVIRGLSDLGMSETPSAETMTLIEKFESQL